jgi:hypothetical protein
MNKLLVSALFLVASLVTANAQGEGPGGRCGPRCQDWRARQPVVVAVQPRAAVVYQAAPQRVVYAQPAPVQVAGGLPEARTGGYLVPQGTVVQTYNFVGWENGQRIVKTQPGFVSGYGGTVVPAAPPSSAIGYSIGQQAAYGASTVVALPGRVIGGAANVVGGVVGGAVGGLFGVFGY